MTLHRLFYEAHNNILDMEIFTVGRNTKFCVADCREARVLGRQGHTRGGPSDFAFRLLCFPMDFLLGYVCYFSIVCVVTPFIAF